ncbi:hypothetical protein MRY87_05735 [bacterium]|nr:hypothetical protein [bacterium]
MHSILVGDFRNDSNGPMVVFSGPLGKETIHFEAPPTDLLLSRSENGIPRYYSISSQIERERSEYYRQLENTQRGSLDITEWLVWYLECLRMAVGDAHLILEELLKRSAFWSHYHQAHFHERQRKILDMLLKGFHGKLTSSKYARINRCSQDTAYRDILDLVERGILVKNPGGGRSTSYALRDLSAILERGSPNTRRE